MTEDSILAIVGNLETQAEREFVNSIQGYSRIYVFAELTASEQLDFDENLIRLIPDSPGFVFAHRPPPEPAESWPEYQAPHLASLWWEVARELTSFDEINTHVDWVCIDPKLASTAEQLAAFTKTEVLTNRRWKCVRNIVSLTPKELTGKNWVIIPNIFSSSFNSSENKISLDLLEEGVCLIRSYLRAGYHLRQNNASLPGWAAQMGGVWMSLLIGILGIGQGEIDKNKQEAFFISAQFREAVTISSVNILANYCLSEKLIGKGDLLEIARKEGLSMESGVLPGESVWFSESVWNQIYQAVILARGEELVS